MYFFKLTFQKRLNVNKFFVKSILAASLLAGCAAANAATDLNNSSSMVFTNGTTFIGATYGMPDTGKTFTANYTFNPANSFAFSSGIISIALGTLSGLNLTSFTLTGNGVTSTGTLTTSPGLQTWTLSAPSLTSGIYTLAAVGKVTGTTGGSFGGNVNISPVPEASTAAMMLGGLALVGFIATRRRRGMKTVHTTGNMMPA
jgi:hypothetical protein